MISVVLVDDEPDALLLLAIRIDLEPDLKVVGTATGGAAALAECHRIQPDVVVVDLLMPGTDGYETIDRLRSELPGVAIVAYSAEVSPFAQRMMQRVNVPLVAKGGDSGPLMDVIRASGAHPE